jgi:DNA-binding NtrC family response regulator
MAQGPRIGLEDLPASAARASGAPAKARAGEATPPDLSLRQRLRRFEKSLIEEALRRAGGSRQVAAKLLRVPLRTLFRRIRACGIVESDVPDTDP